MYIDALLQLSDAQAITVDAPSTNTIDFGNSPVKRPIATGEPITLCFQVDVAADFTTTDETYEFQAIQSDNADLSSPDIICLRTFTAAQLAAGTQHYLPIPSGEPTKRYFGVYYNVGGTTPSVTITAWLTPQSMITHRTTFPIGSVMQ